MLNINWRDFLKLGAILPAKVAAGKGCLDVNSGKLIVKGGKDLSLTTGNERVAIPSTCWQCVTRDSLIGYVEDDKLVKLEGHPNSIRGRGKICAKGQAGINQVYDPDRVLYPMRRVGKRGEGKWKRITWNAALDELASRLKKLSDVGHPEKFMFHYGRMTGSASKLIKDVFLASYGTKTIGDHTSICEGGKWTAQELTWGNHYDNWDFDNTGFVLNFGSNCLEAHTNHIPLAQRLVSAMAERRVKTITFDVRLSNTAARSTEWVPIKPGTDGAVVLAMCQVIMEEKLYDRDFLKFVKATKDHRASADEKIAALKSHLFKYTPQWAEKISGVNALKTKSLAIEFAKTKPAVVISYRGAIAHYNGNETERAIQMLSAITGNIDNPGGRCKAVSAEWNYPKGSKEKPKARKLDIMDGFRGQVAYPTHHVSHQVLKMIKDGRAGRPEIYMWFCYNPVYANGEVQENIDILKDECLIPFTVCSNAYYDESATLADLILPHPSYLELWDWEDMVSPAQIPEFYIRQALVKPLGEVRDLGDVVCELAERMGFPLGFSSKEEFVRMSCELTPGVKEAGGFEYMKKYGVWHDPNAMPKYYSYKTEVEAANLGKDAVIFDEETGVYWNWQKSEAHSEEEAKEKGYTHTMDSYKGYVGQEIGEKVYVGFKPDKVNKSGYLELYSILLREKGFAPLPTYLQIPEHQKIGSDELILTTYKVNVHTHSRTENCKWLTEIVHDNPAWINPKSADIKGIKTGDKIIVMSRTGKIETKAFVTEGVVPGVVAISHHLGHWGYGRYASGNKPPITEGSDPDLKLKWWTEHGVHPNWLIPNSPDPINGQQRWMDTVVKVTKA